MSGYEAASIQTAVLCRCPEVKVHLFEIRALLDLIQNDFVISLQPVFSFENVKLSSVRGV